MFQQNQIIAVLALGAAIAASGQSQSAQAQSYVRDTCVKVREGKGAEYDAYLKDVVKINKVRVDAGEVSRYSIARSVAPQGRSARCDYHLISIYAGFPPEAPTPEKTSADMKKAGIAMSREALRAKRDELSSLVSVETYRIREAVGSNEKGSYLRLDYYKLKSGTQQEWLKAEQTEWKPVFVAMQSENPGITWGLATLALQAGSSLPYNAVTANGFPNWEAVGKGTTLRATWKKVHPAVDFTSGVEKANSMGELHHQELLKFIEVVKKK